LSQNNIKSFEELKELFSTTGEALKSMLPDGDGEAIVKSLIGATPEEVREIEKKLAKKYKDAK